MPSQPDRSSLRTIGAVFSSLKILTSGLIGAGGDAAAQLIAMRGDDDQGKSKASFDFARTARFTLLNAFLVAPTLHNWSVRVCVCAYFVRINTSGVMMMIILGE